MEPKNSLPINNEYYTASISSDEVDIEKELNIEDTVENNRRSSDKHKSIRRYIHKASTELNDEKEIEIDNTRLGEIVSDAGKYAFGIISVEVWVLDEYAGNLQIPLGGRWVDEKERNRKEFVSLQQSEPICSPGVCLAGTLWSESHSPMINSPSQTSLQGMVKSVSRMSLKGLQFSSSQTGHNQSNHNFSWRDIKSIELDPDKSKTNRIELLLDAGIGLAASCPFNQFGHKGVVIYLAKADTKIDELSTTENMVYIQRATDLIGAMVAVIDARRASVISKRKMNNTLKSSSGSETKKETHSTSNAENSKAKIIQMLSAWWEKCKGGNLQIPPVMTYSQSSWTWVGVFFGLLTLSGMNEYFKLLSDGQFYLLMGPFGALMTLQYGLTQAPASQPRNTVLGQAVAGFIALSFTYIPETILPVWLRVAIAPAFSICFMVKLGISHPPAGAHSVIYASGGTGWIFYLLVVLASIVSVLPATIINNMNPKRQYPTYWGNGALVSPFRYLYVHLIKRDQK